MSDITEGTPVSEEEEPRARKETTEYRALVDLSYGDKRVPAGDVVSDIPGRSIQWLLKGGFIEKVS